MLRVKRNRVKLTRAQNSEIDEIRSVQRHAYNFGADGFLKDPTVSVYDCMKLYAKIRPGWSKSIARKWLDSAIMEARRAADLSFKYGNGKIKFRSRKRSSRITVTNYGGRPEV